MYKASIRSTKASKWDLVFKKSFKGSHCLLIVTFSWTLTLVLNISHQPERTLEMEWAVIARSSVANDMNNMEGGRSEAWGEGHFQIDSQGTRWRACLLWGLLGKCSVRAATEVKVSELCLSAVSLAVQSVYTRVDYSSRTAFTWTGWDRIEAHSRNKAHSRNVLYTSFPPSYSCTQHFLPWPPKWLA